MASVLGVESSQKSERGRMTTWLEKISAAACLLCLTVFVSAILAQSDTPIQIQVLQSRLNAEAIGFKGDVETAEMLQIEAVIQGQTYWLEAGTAKNGLLKPGKYSGKLIKDDGSLAYKVNQEWQLTYPDGKHENFKIVAIVGK
jgi:hypothetical protein